MNFCLLSHNEPEIFRLLDGLIGERVYVIDDFSNEDHLRKIKYHPSMPSVVQRKLGKDFSAQRNFAHSFIPELEWVCWLDADEEIVPSVFLPLLKETAKEPADAISFERINMVVDKDGEITFRSLEQHIRAYRHNGIIRWEDALHEKVTHFESMIKPWAPGLIAHVKTSERWEQQKEFYRSFL